MRRDLANISTGGMGVIHAGDPRWKETDSCSGLVIIDKDEFGIQARICHVSEIVAGCEFVGENTKLKRAIEKYLRVEILALNLRQVADAYLKQDPLGDTTWFTDGQNEIYVVTGAKGGDIISFHMTFLGHYVEGGGNGGVRIGNVKESNKPMGHKGSALLDFSRDSGGEILGLAVTFVQNIERMPAEMRERLLEKLKS